MRYYLIDELDLDAVNRIKAALDEAGLAGGIEDIYYLPVKEDFLTQEQREHLDSCGPYILALETGKDFLRLELLVRARNKLRCACITYASSELRKDAIDYLDRFIKQLDIPV